MQNKAFRSGPVAIGAAAANILNPPTAAGGVNAGNSPQYIILRHVRVVNKTVAAVTVSFWLGATGATAAGTEVIGQGLSVPANSYIDWYGYLRIDATDFLVAQASAATSLSFTGEGEIGVAG